MTLPPLVLDDLTWETLTEAARRRIPAASAGTWTLHAPVDPGVTVMELLAYLLEQRLYFLDQVPDELVLAILRLLGVELPRPARPATTVLQPSIEPAGTEAYPVAKGTVLSRDPLRQVTFTLDEDVTVLPVAGPLSLTAGGRDRTADLLAGRGVPLLAASGQPDEFRLVLPLVEGAACPPAGTVLTLLVELDAPAACPPSWHPDAVADVPPPATLTWHWYAAGHPEREWPVDEVVDGTAGLRRSGVVALRLPDAWCDGSTTSAGYGLRVHTEAATYPAPPVLRQAVPNVGVAVHREMRAVTEVELADQIRGWRRLPGQRLVLPDAQGTLLDPQVTIRRGGEDQKWEQVPGWAFSGPGDRVFVADRDAGAVLFGDGLTGGIPVPDQPGSGVVTVAYARGGGTAGNGGRTGNWLPLTQADPEAIVTARNVVPADGGRDAETVAQARTRAADELAEVRRAVTVADFESLARTTGGVAVARCHVAVGAHPAYPCSDVPGAVTVRVVPAVTRDDAALADPATPAAVHADPGTLAAVRKRLAAARLLGTEIYADGPRYRSVRLRVDVRGRPANPAAVRATLRLALRRYLDPIVGGDDRTGWPFGGALRPSALIRVAQAALGDAAEVAAVGIGLDGDEPVGDCADTLLLPGELPALDGTTLRVVAAPTGSGLS